MSPEQADRQLLRFELLRLLAGMIPEGSDLNDAAQNLANAAMVLEDYVTEPLDDADEAVVLAASAASAGGARRKRLRMRKTDFIETRIPFGTIRAPL